MVSFEVLADLKHRGLIAICGKVKARLCGHAVPVMPLLRHQRPSLNGSGDRGRSVAIVIWLLSRNIALAGYYVWSMHPDVFTDEETVPDEPQLALLMLGWWARAKTQRWVRDAVDDPNHKTRVLADEFLMRSLVAEYVFRQNALNKSVQPSAIITCYLRYWMYRPVPFDVQDKLVKLTYNTTDRKNLMRRLREEWHIRPGIVHPERSLSRDSVCRSVGIVATIIFRFSRVVTGLCSDTGQHPCGDQITTMQIDQVVTYLRWLRYVIDVTLRDKTYVIVNVDETSVNAVGQKKHGYVGQGIRSVVAEHQHRGGRRDRSDIKTTLMGVICDQPELQPYLPQVFMPKYTQNATPPAWARDMYGRQGFPFQYWHRTGGSSSPATFRIWCNSLRSSVHSFNSEAYILLIMDCHSSHLDLQTVNHLAAMGIVTVVIPAQLTWLLQPLDVYVYAVFKRVLRGLLHHQEAAGLEEGATLGSWITPTASAAKSVLCKTDWSDKFDKVGAGINYGPVRPDIQKYVGAELVYPELPLLRDFAAMVSRVVHTEGTRELHRGLMQPAIRVRDLASNIMPRRGAIVELPNVMPATKRLPPGRRPAGNLDPVLRQYVYSQQAIQPLGGIVGPPAVQIEFRRPHGD